MTLREYIASRDRLNALFDRVDHTDLDDEIRSHFARYLCVMVSDYLENSCRVIYREAAREQSAPRILRFVENKLDDFQNPSMEKIYVLAGSFDPIWERDLRARTEGELKDAIDSIVANRHLIVHGSPVGLTYIRIKQYYDRAERVIAIILEQCGVRI